mmetsp:Transcript_4123/g.7560  ORF Transcript_4123/g.7560 Transcript_4123/m.7560 type:complete len:263 (+) Transcript_4123:40-828(+)
MAPGYCHQCSKEVEAEVTESGDYRCLDCNTVGYVECEDEAHPGTDEQRSPVPPLLRNGETMFSAFGHFLQGMAGALEAPSGARGIDGLQQSVLGAVASGVDRAVRQTQGLSDADREWVQRQGSRMTELATGGFNLLRNAGPLRGFLEQHLGQDWQSQRSGLDTGVVAKWLDEREIPADSVLPNSGAPLGLREGEAWQCPICFSGCEVGADAAHNGSPDEGQRICLLCDSDGSAWHVFHKSCALEWLQRSATCPLCRKQLCIS